MRREAEALAEDGYVVHAIALRPRSGASPTHVGGVHLHELPLTVRRGGKLRYLYQYAMFFLLSTALLIRLHLFRRFVLIHVHSLPDFQVFGALLLRLGGAKVLLDLHEAMPEIVAARFRLSPGNLWVRLAEISEWLSCRTADHVVVANDGIRATLIDRKIPASRITAVYNPGNASDTPFNPQRVRVDLNLPPGRLIVHAGGINPERDIETLIRAFARLSQASELHLVIAGDGDPEYVAQLSGIARDLGIGDRVRFVGRLPQDQAIALMSLSSVGVVTLESNPLTELAWPSRIPEFALLRKPLIVPMLRFLSQTLEDGAQFYIPGNAESLAREINAVLQAPHGRESAVAKAETICGRFEWGRMRTVLRGICETLERSHAN